MCVDMLMSEVMKVNGLSSGPLVRYRTEIRAGLLALAVPVIVVGGWALIAPHSFYDDFPIHSAHWISGLGPYQEHLVRDFGSLYLALGLLFVFAAVVLDRLLAGAVLAASLVFQVPHFIFHALNTSPFSTPNNAVNLVLLGSGLLLTVLLLAVIRRAGGEPGRQPQPMEGGISYGTG
jgi:hypothetical protein